MICFLQCPQNSKYPSYFVKMLEGRAVSYELTIPLFVDQPFSGMVHNIKMNVKRRF